MPPYLLALLLHGVLGGLDVFLNHEWLARLPAKPAARTEEAVHSAREAVFGTLFLSLAWFEWHGAAAWWIAALFLCEVALSTCDVLIEGRIRVLPAPERVLHLFLFMNLGALLVLVGQAALGWQALPAAPVAVDHGWASWLLTGMGLMALIWSVRDAISAWRLGSAGGGQKV